MLILYHSIKFQAIKEKSKHYSRTLLFLLAGTQDICITLGRIMTLLLSYREKVWFKRCMGAKLTTSGHVMINFMHQLDRVTDCPNI